MRRHRAALFPAPVLLLALLLCVGPASAQEPPRVWFVRNTAAAGGSGSLSAPFDHLALAQFAAAPGEVIFLFAGDGTARGQDIGIALKDGQSLIGEHGGLVVNGVAVVPPGAKPVITSVVGPAIRLGNGNAVRGLTIADSLGAGITADDPISDLELDDVTVLRPGAECLRLDDVSGTVRISRSELDGAPGELARIATTSDLALEIESVTFQNTAPPLGDEGLQLTAGGTGTIRVAIVDSTFRNLLGEAIDIGGRGGAADAHTLDVHLLRNSFLGRFDDGAVRGANGVLVKAHENENVFVAIEENLFETVGGAGAITLRADDRATLRARLSRNTIAGADASAVDLAADESTRLEVTVDANVIRDTDRAGIVAVGFPGNAQIVLAIRDNRIERTGREGVALSLYGGSMRASVNGNEASAPTGAGFALANLGAGTFHLIGDPSRSAAEELGATNSGTASATGTITVIAPRHRAVRRP